MNRVELENLVRRIELAFKAPTQPGRGPVEHVGMADAAPIFTLAYGRDQSKWPGPDTEHPDGYRDQYHRETVMVAVERARRKLAAEADIDRRVAARAGGAVAASPADPPADEAPATAAEPLAVVTAPPPQVEDTTEVASLPIGRSAAKALLAAGLTHVRDLRDILRDDSRVGGDLTQLNGIGEVARDDILKAIGHPLPADTNIP